MDNQDQDDVRFVDYVELMDGVNDRSINGIKIEEVLNGTRAKQEDDGQTTPGEDDNLEQFLQRSRIRDELEKNALERFSKHLDIYCT